MLTIVVFMTANLKVLLLEIIKTFYYLETKHFYVKGLETNEINFISSDLQNLRIKFHEKITYQSFSDTNI